MTRLDTRTAVAVAVAVWASLQVQGAAARQPSVTTYLDRYAAGQFESVVADLAGDLDFDALLNQLKRDGPGWIDALGSAARDRRELVAATFALEAARADEWYQWIFVWKPPEMGTGALALSGSLGSSPAIVCSTSAQSSTVRVSKPV